MALTPQELKALPLAQVLDRQTQEGARELYERLPDNELRCYACGHRCLIRDDRRGICKVRFNKDGTLYVPWGYVAALQCDPTEKKPFYHFLPGSNTLTFGMLGCDYHCPYCQNWLTSQALRDPAAGARPELVTPEGLVDLALESGAQVVGSSYNEPLITAEWAVAIFEKAKAAGLKTCFISNGNATEQVLTYLRPWCDGYKIDLKAMSQKNYRYLGGVLEHVLETIQMVHAMGFWMEVVTLIVPGWNDSEEELQKAAEFLVAISPDIPWHITAFHKDYQMTDPDNTPADTLLRA
ncbi:MAG: radical SAM protein, partial [candidate division NC10 bacterium]